MKRYFTKEEIKVTNILWLLVFKDWPKTIMPLSVYASSPLTEIGLSLY